MTLAEFRATGRDVADLAYFLDDAALKGAKGRLYTTANLYIERLPTPDKPDDKWVLTLGNMQHAEPLPELEARLYEFAWSNGEFPKPTDAELMAMGKEAIAEDDADWGSVENIAKGNAFWIAFEQAGYDADTFTEARPKATSNELIEDALVFLGKVPVITTTPRREWFASNHDLGHGWSAQRYASPTGEGETMTIRNPDKGLRIDLGEESVALLKAIFKGEVR